MSDDSTLNVEPPEPEPATLLVNEATGEVEQRLPASGKITVDDGEGGTLEVTPAKLRDLSVQRAIDHTRDVSGEVLAPGPREASSAVEQVLAEARDAGEELSPSEALARAQEAISSSSSATVSAPDRVLVDGEPVAYRIEKA